MSAIKIIAAPPGEAPQEVREAWVGLVLPLLQPGLCRSKTIGILTGPKTPLGVMMRLWTKRYTTTVGYVVDSATAIEILAHAHPEAAQWWRENAPHHTTLGRRFLFAAQACQEVPEIIWPPPPRNAPPLP